jgi:hypothetical protein
MSDIISVQPFFTSQKRVSRGFHRLGIFLGLTTVVIFLIIGAQQYDPLSWWIGGVLVALMVYGLARLAGWAISGFTEPDVALPKQNPSPVLQSPPAPPDPLIAEPVRSSVEPVVAPSERILEPARREPKGIGGWLLLPVLGLIITPFKLGAGAIEVIQALYGLPATVDLSLKLVIIGETVAHIAMFALAIYTLSKLKNKQRTFPKTYITLFAANFVVSIVDLLVVYVLLGVVTEFKEMKDLAATGFALVIWGPYMLYSKRVENTFVN